MNNSSTQLQLIGRLFLNPQRMRKYYKIQETHLRLARQMIQRYQTSSKKITYDRVINDLYVEYGSELSYEDAKNIVRVILKELGIYTSYFYKYLEKVWKQGIVAKNKLRCDICGSATTRVFISENGIDYYHPVLAEKKGIKENYVICYKCLMKKIIAGVMSGDEKVESKQKAKDTQKLC